MGWAVGFDPRWQRDIGYGVPAICDFPGCNRDIDRGLSFVCGSEPYGGERGCGLFFCHEHLNGDKDLCARCIAGEPPFPAKPDTLEWMRHKLTDESWHQWRVENSEKAAELVRLVAKNRR